MSRASVRTAVATYLAPTPAGIEPGVFTGSPITGLATVRTAQPREIPDSDFSRGLPPGSSGGAVGVVRVDTQTETREAFGGLAGPGNRGYRLTRYDLTLAVYWRSMNPSAEQSLLAFDATLDGVLTALRTDVTLGGQVFAAAEVVTGDALRVDLLDPMVTNGGALTEIGLVSFPVLEWQRA